MSDFFSNIIGNTESSRWSSTTVVNASIVIWAIIFGLIISFFAVYYKRRVIGALVRAIRDAEAVDEDSAKTLAELEQQNNVSAIAALKKSAALRRIITICPEKSVENNNAPDKASESDVPVAEAKQPAKNDVSSQKIEITENTRLYISPENETAARVKYGSGEEPLWPIIVGSLALVALGILSYFILP